MNKEVCRPLEKLLGFYPLTQSSHEIEEHYNKELVKYKSKENQKIKTDITQAEQLIATNTQAIRSIMSSIDSSINGMISQKTDNALLPIVIESLNLLKSLVSSSFDEIDVIKLDVFIIESRIAKLAEQYKQSIFPSFWKLEKLLIVLSRRKMHILRLSLNTLKNLKYL
jgi:hypothetical protein